MDDFLVTGVSRAGYGSGTVRITRTAFGWSQRAVKEVSDAAFSDCLNADYVSAESEGLIDEWIKCDFTTYSTCVRA